MKYLMWVVLVVLYLALAWKNPLKTNNLISNLEPYPDTLYYSVPAWNLVHGNGFKMSSFGIEIKSVVPPLYGLYLAPFFKVFNDVRSYYWANILLGLVSIWLYIRLTEKIFEDSNIKYFLQFFLGLVLVTNFYFYNLPTLLMAENLLIPLTLASAVLILEKYSRKNLILTGIVVVLLFLTKLSALPVIACLALGMFLKVNKNLKLLVAGVLSVLGIIGVIVLWSSFILYFKGIGDFNLTNIFKTLPLYLSEFVGKNGKYLWYYNQQIEPLVGWLALLGCGLGLVWKKYRKITLILGMIILTVVIFHSQMSYPEGRYLSTVIPLYILFVGIFVDLFQKYWIKLAVVSIFLAGYLGVKTTVNGFYERKVTTLKRQILNNQLENNEVPWNYLAMENFNKFFKNKDDNQFLGTLLPPFYVAYFGNVNFKFLPISPLQEFAGGNKGYIEKTYENDGTLVNLYNRLIREGKSVYVSNYYLNNFQGKLSPDYKILENTFSFNQVSDGCMDLCKIYKLELKKK